MSPELRRSEWQRHLWSLDLSLESFRDERILDVGCGPTGIGYFITAAKRVGVDPLAETYERWNGYFGEPIELVASQAEQLPFGTATFDTVFCINCIDHSQDPAAILTEIARVLRPGGLLVFHVDLDSPLRRLHKRLRPRVRRMHPHSLKWKWLSAELAHRFTVLKQYRDEQVFAGNLRQMKYEAFWDGLLYRVTSSPTWMNHVWLTARRYSTARTDQPDLNAK
jgi:ubiquinone/menaquinone biosynthesis C-methylase UbiE